MLTANSSRKAKVHSEVLTWKKHSDIHTVNSINRIKCFRVILLMALVATGVASAVVSFVVLRQQENEKYRSEFRALTHEIFMAVDEGFGSKITTLDHMSTVYSYHCPHVHQWPNCSLPKNYFEAFTSPLVDISTSRTIAFSPIVWPHQKESFENYSVDLFEREGYPAGTGVSSFGRGIYKKNNEGMRCRDSGKSSFSKYELFVPVLQPAQLATNWPGIMFNMHSQETRATSIDAMLDCVTALEPHQRAGRSVVQRCTAVSDFIQVVLDSVPSPASAMYTPVFPLHDNTTVVGTQTIIFNWESILNGFALSEEDRVNCVVESSRGGRTLSQHSFSLSAGQAHYLGEGDMHSSSKGMSVTEQLSYGSEMATAVKYKLVFFSTDEYYDQYHSMIPLASSLVCVSIIIIISTLFVMYDVLVKRETLANKMLLDSKRVFVKFVSHEIRTPINTITLGLQLLASRLQSLDLSALDAASRPSPPTSQALSSIKWPVGVRHEDSVMTETKGSGTLLLETQPWVEDDGGAFVPTATTAARSILAECLELVDELAESSKTAVVVLNELINYDKIEMKKFHVERRICDLNEVLQSTVRQLELQAKQKQVVLNCLMDSAMDKSLFVIGDAVKLGQVIRNVLSNALKFAPLNSAVVVDVRWYNLPPLIAPETRLDPVSGDEYLTAGSVIIRVQDAGPGLSPVQLKTLFQEGVQFNANDLQAGQGSGLGLWISREIMQQHGGSISAESAGLGHGAMFSVTVPVLVPSNSRVRSSRHVMLKNSFSFDGTDELCIQTPGRVLVVDDAVTSVKILSRLLVNAGMTVTSAYDGKECLARVNQCLPGLPFDLIIMDFEMPVMNGPDAAKTLREAGHTMPIIGVTGNVLAEDKEYFVACGADWVLPKPLNLTTLLNAYAVVMGTRHKEVSSDIVKRTSVSNMSG